MKIGWKGKGKSVNPDTLSEQEFLTQILEICGQFPDLRNPADDDGFCYYIANEQTVKGSLVANHCLIGQWWISQGYPKSELPEGNIGADMFLSDHDYPENISSLARLIQDMADRSSYGSLTRPPWRDVAVRIKNTFAAELRQT